MRPADWLQIVSLLIGAYLRYQEANGSRQDDKRDECEHPRHQNHSAARSQSATVENVSGT